MIPLFVKFLNNITANYLSPSLTGIRFRPSVLCRFLVKGDTDTAIKAVCSILLDLFSVYVSQGGPDLGKRADTLGQEDEGQDPSRGRVSGA